MDGARDDKKYRREIKKAPEAVVAGGKFQFGTYTGLIREVNPLEAHQPLGPFFPDPLLNFRLREWQAMQIGNDRFFMIVVLYSTKALGLAQLKILDRQTGEKYHYEKIVPAWQIHLPRTLYADRGWFKEAGFSIVFHNDLDTGLLEASTRFTGQAGQPDLEANFFGQFAADRWTPMGSVMKLGENRAVYSGKCLMPLKGEMILGGETHQFSEDTSFMILDDHHGFYPYNMAYDWVTGVGDRQGGEPLWGFNLTRNMALDQEEINENCFWFDGDFFPLPPVFFERPHGVDQAWKITDLYGHVDVRFIPQMAGNIHIDFGIFKSEYHGPFGHFEGKLRSLGGSKELDLSRAFGMGEKVFMRA